MDWQNKKAFIYKDTDKVIDTILYDNFWYLILPLKTTVLLHFIIKNMGKSSRWECLLEKLKNLNLDYSIESYSKDDRIMEIEKKICLENNGYYYPTTLDENIQLLSLFSLINVLNFEKNILFKSKIPCVFEYFKTIPIEYIKEMYYYKEFKQFYNVLNRLLWDIKEKNKLEGCLKDYLLKLNCSYTDLCRSFKIINHYLSISITVDSIGFEDSFSLNIDTNSKIFNDLLFFFNISS
ncbi:MAG: hypothetical protein MJA82_06745 [Clostridia bacterium]|nr:hypothetical protein [Clostridia bacterium]